MKITRSQLRRIILEAMNPINESSTTSDMLKSAFKNAVARSGSKGYEVPAADFKRELEAQIKSVEDARRRAPAMFKGISEQEKIALEDLLLRIPEEGSFGQVHLRAATEQVDADAPDAPRAKPIDMSALPKAGSVDVAGKIKQLASKLPAIFGPESESDPDIKSISAGVRESDKKNFSHGMSIESKNISTGIDNPEEHRYKVFPKDASGRPLRFPDGSIVFFRLYEPLTRTVRALFDIYTNSFVSSHVFDKRNEVYRSLWQRGELPSPITMQQQRLTRR